MGQMEAEMCEIAENLPWYLADPDIKNNPLESIISCPACKKTQGSFEYVYERKGSTVLANGIGISSCPFCGTDYKLFTSPKR